MEKIIISLLIITLGFAGFGDTAVSRKYSGIRPDDENGRKGLLNPERGFRWENRIASSNPVWADAKWLNSIKGCRDDGLTMTQAYCELLDYCDMKQIPEDKIRKLEESFAAVRKSGIKLLLCFRYEMNVKDKKGPTTEVILAHIKQLKPVLRKNMDVIAVLQTGFIGLYGEWHRSYHKLDSNTEAQKKILDALLDMLPPERKMVIRYPRHKNAYVKNKSRRPDLQPINEKDAHSMRPESRIGFCDHGFMVGKNDAGTFAPRPSSDYDYMTQESLFLPMDAEFFWTFSKPYGWAKDDGLEAIKRLWEHHYTLLSYAHNHSRYEGWQWKDKYGARYSLDEWKDEEVKPEFLKQNNLPVSDGYFEDKDGNYVKRSIFEYVRDHLGYRLELRNADFPATTTSGKAFSASIKLVNRGFAAPVNPRPVYMVLIGKDGVHKISQADVDVRKWYPCDPENRKKLAPEYAVKFSSASFPQVPAGKYELGIWMPDYYKSIQNDARYAIRFANRDVQWWSGKNNDFGINVIGNITVE